MSDTGGNTMKEQRHDWHIYYIGPKLADRRVKCSKCGFVTETAPVRAVNKIAVPPCRTKP